MENDICFVIQPFEEVFNKRYDDTYKSAIEEAGLEPYRVDYDPSTDIIIDRIEQKIKDSRLCLADISLNNPNVWYELGYALALGKSVVMICCKNRQGRYPFDIQHRNVIEYDSDSKSDFDALKNRITQRIKSIIKTNDYPQSDSIIPLNSVDNNNIQLPNIDDLKPYELSLISFIVSEQPTQNNHVSIYQLMKLMKNQGFDDFKTSIGIHMLREKNLLFTTVTEDYHGEPIDACRLTDKGLKFVMLNLDKFENVLNPISDDDIPF